MINLRSKIQEIYSLEQLSGGQTALHRLHPGVKWVSTLVYLVTVSSFPRHAFAQLLPYLFYPVVLIAVAQIPWKLVWKRALLALPFVLFAGLSNLIVERQVLFTVCGIPVCLGMVSFLTLVLRTFLCVTAVVVLVGVTPFSALMAQLRRAHVPQTIVQLLELTYRYLGTLMAETAEGYTAYALRSAGKKGLQLRHMGSFVGMLLLRSFDRAERVYAAMKCRGYDSAMRQTQHRQWRGSDWCFLVATVGSCVFCRCVDVMAWLQKLVEGVFL